MDSNPIMSTTYISCFKLHLLLEIIKKRFVFKNESGNIKEKYRLVLDNVLQHEKFEFANGRIRVFNNNHSKFNKSDIYVLYKHETPVLFTTNIIDFANTIANYIMMGEATFMESVCSTQEEQAGLFRVAFAMENEEEIASKLNGLSITSMVNGKMYLRKDIL